MLNSSESLAEKFIRRGFWLYLFSFLIWPLGYIVKIILSADLSVEEIGLLYGIISLVWLLWVYHDLGLTESLNFFLPKFIVQKDWIRFKSLLAYSLGAQLITSTLIGLVLFFSAGYLAEHYFRSTEAVGVIQIFCLFFFGMNIHSMNTTIFWVTQNTKLQKGTEFLRMIFVVLFTLGLYFLDRGNLITYAWTWIGGVLIGIFFGSIFMYRTYYVPYLKNAAIIYDKELIHKVIKYALWVVLAANVGTVLGQIDMQLIIYLLGTKDAGYYTNYLSIIGIPFIIITPIIGFLFPVISELHGKWDEAKIIAIKTLFYKYFSVLGLITSMFMFVFGPAIANVLFGLKFTMSGIILQYSAFFIVCNFLLQINFQILAWVGRIKERVKILGVGLIFNIILNLILIHLYGVVGSALAVGLSWIPLWYLSDRSTRMYSNGFDFVFFIKNLILTFVIGGLSWYFLTPLFTGITRVQWLISITGIAFLTMIPFILVNKKEWILFLRELKNMKK